MDPATLVVIAAASCYFATLFSAIRRGIRNIGGRK
jgi:hypothetical protein